MANQIAAKQNAVKPANANKKKGRFFKEFFGEVRKLSWPTAKDLVSNTLTVLAFIALFAILIGVLDAILKGVVFDFLYSLGS